MTTGSEHLLAEAINLFEYLAQVQRVRERPVRNAKHYEGITWLAEFPEHPAVTTTHRATEPAPDDILFSIDRVVRVDPPKLVPSLTPWISGDLDDSGAEPTVREWVAASEVPDRIPRITENGPSESILLDDEPEVRSACDAFLAAWEVWAATDRRDEPVRNLYTDLFAMSQTAKAHSESFELVLGVGALSWKPQDHEAVQRHLLTFPVQIKFDEASGTLTASRVASPTPLAVELDMVDPALVTSQVNDLKDRALGYEGHPFHRDLVGLEVRRFAHALDAQGSYSDEEIHAAIGPDLRAAYAPALILRRRSQRGLIDIFETIRNQLESSGEIPPGLLPLIDPDFRPVSDQDESPGGIVEIGSDEIFLPMPVNDRQLRVIQKVDQKAQVVVQGPPGTGKTHTAAALLSHLLAQGKRVLVTAHTDRALHEVRDKLPAEIRPLSVAVVGSSQAELADLRVAVDTISSRADEYNAVESEHSIARHLTEIDVLRRERGETYTALRESREAETTDHEIGPYTGTLSAIAQAIDRARCDHAWLVDLVPVVAGTSSPLSGDEALAWLHLLNDSEVNQDEAESGRSFPTVESIPTALDVATKIDTEASASQQADAHSSWRTHSLYSSVVALEQGIRNELNNRMTELAKGLEGLESRSDGWVGEAVQDIRAGRRQTWQARAVQVRDLIDQVRPHVVAIGPLTRITADADNLAVLDSMARSLHGHLAQGKQIKLRADGAPQVGVLAPKVVKQSQVFFESVRVDGLPATSTAQLELFIHHVSSTRIFDALDRVWPASVAIPEEDTLDERLQWHVTELGQLDEVLAMADNLTQTEQWVSTHGLKSPNWADLADIRSYAELVDAATSADRLDEARSSLSALHIELERQAAWTDSSPVVSALALAVSNRDRNAYREAVDRLSHLHTVRTRVKRRDLLKTQLVSAAPGLAAAVSDSPTDPSWNDRLGSLPQAWNWAAAGSWLRSHEPVDVNLLQERLDGIEQRLRHEIESSPPRGLGPMR